LTKSNEGLETTAEIEKNNASNDDADLNQFTVSQPSKAERPIAASE